MDIKIKKEEGSDADTQSNADSFDDNSKDDYDLIPSDSKTPGEILDEFCLKLQDVNTTIPDPVILHFMKQSGFISNDAKLVKIISLASQKFISEIVNDCMQYHKLKSNTKSQQTNLTLSSTTNINTTTGTAASAADKKSINPNATVLTLDDLSTVLQDYGINVKKPLYFL